MSDERGCVLTGNPMTLVVLEDLPHSTQPIFPIKYSCQFPADNADEKLCEGSERAQRDWLKTIEVQICHSCCHLRREPYGFGWRKCIFQFDWAQFSRVVATSSVSIWYVIASHPEVTGQAQRKSFLFFTGRTASLESSIVEVTQGMVQCLGLYHSWPVPTPFSKHL